MPKDNDKSLNRYSQILERVFLSNYKPGSEVVPFRREELSDAASDLGMALPKNLGDVVYSARHRTDLPKAITEVAPEGKMWIITSRGKGLYQFELASSARILPSSNRVVTKVPNATPEIIRKNALGDEQSLLATVRYNRLIDIFLGLTAYSLQTHWRTTTKGIGQLEVDEIYVAVDRFGTQYIVPVQAKGGSDQIGIVQITQDLKACAEKYPSLVARSVAAQFLSNDVIALFELALHQDSVVVLQEEHYQLVNADEISDTDRDLYAKRSEALLPLN